MAKYPKDYEKNIKRRYDLNIEISNDPDFASDMYKLCKQDILFWMNCFCWTEDPRKEPSMLPFITYPFQDKIIKEIQKSINEKKNMIIEKCRDMGMSWIMVYVFQHYWLFGGSGNHFLIGSRTEEEIDTVGVMDSIFEKARYNLYRQPKEFLPVGFRKDRHDSFCKLINPQTGSYLKGTSNKYFGTGGRYKAIFLDEFSKWDHKDESCWQACSDASPCKIAVSSANGMNNLFYRLRSGKAGKIKVHRIEWRLHPEKDTRWYKREENERTPSDLASNVNIDYQASVGRRAAENWKTRTHVKFCRRETNLPLELNCDFNVNPMFWVVSQTIKGIRYTFKEYYIETALTENVIGEFIYDYRDQYDKTIYIYGDYQGFARSTRNYLNDYQIIVTALKKAGWEIKMMVPGKNPPHKLRISTINKRLKDTENGGESYEIVSTECKMLIESIESTQLNGDSGEGLGWCNLGK